MTGHDRTTASIDETVEPAIEEPTKTKQPSRSRHMLVGLAIVTATYAVLNIISFGGQLYNLNSVPYTQGARLRAQRDLAREFTAIDIPFGVGERLASKIYLAATED